MKEFKDLKYGDLSGQTYDSDIFCGSRHLTSLKGAPKVVKGIFSCYNNNLTSLEGAPEVIEGDFYCWKNKLLSLKDAPKVVEGGFICWGNNLTTLEGASKVVEGNFDCSNNKLIFLKYLPKKIDGDFVCTDNSDLKPKNSWEYIFQSEIKGEIEADFKTPTKEDYELYKTVKGNMKKFWEIYDMKEILK